MNAPQHAVVEVSAEAITLRVGTRWLRFTATSMEQDHAPSIPFNLEENGNVRVGGGAEEEMDFAAERFAREMLLAS
jgi:hypothetical protein